MIYCDTSLLVSALTVEAGSVKVQRWLANQEAAALCISGWVVTEFSSAVALKLRRSELTRDDAALALTNWRSLQQDRLITIPVPSEAFALAARFCDMTVPGLRAGDALHLAVASLGGHSLATLDARMRVGAGAVGVPAVSAMLET